MPQASANIPAMQAPRMTSLRFLPLAFALADLSVWNMPFLLIVTAPTDFHRPAAAVFIIGADANPLGLHLRT
jgi:hypothetical protein